MSHGLTQQQVSALLDLTTRRVQQMESAAEGPPRSADGSYDPRALGEWMRKKTVDGADKARLIKAQADKATMEAAAMSGELVSVLEVKRFWQKVCGAMRSRLISIPPSFAPLVIGLSAPEIQALLQRAINEALGELSSDGFPGDQGSVAGKPASTNAGS